MIKMISILLTCLFLSGCVTSFQAQRKALSKSYNGNKIATEEYEKQLDEIAKKERAAEIKKKSSTYLNASCDKCGRVFSFSQLSYDSGGGQGTCPYCGSNQDLQMARKRYDYDEAERKKAIAIQYLISRQQQEQGKQQQQQPKLHVMPRQKRYTIYNKGGSAVGTAVEQDSGGITVLGQ